MNDIIDDHDNFLGLIQELVASERMQSERYRHYYHLIPDTRVRDELLEHSQDEINHFTLLGEKLIEYGEVPTIGMPADKEIATVPTVDSYDTRALLEEIKVAELEGFTKYEDLLAKVVQAKDTGFRVLLEQILLKEEEHIRDINRLLRIYS